MNGCRLRGGGRGRLDLDEGRKDGACSVGVVVGYIGLKGFLKRRAWRGSLDQWEALLAMER